MFKKIRIIFFLLLLLSLSLIIFKNIFKSYYYDLLEYWTLRDKIVWSENIEINWNDFKNQDRIGFFPKVGLSARYDVDDSILFRSKTVFIPKESFASDTTKMFKLRIANAKFNLLEVYRRRMEKFVDSLRENKIYYYKPSDFKILNRKIYNEFDREWNEFLSSTDSLNSLLLLERKINKELYNK